MHDAFRDAEGCATALDEAFSGARSFEDAMADYQATRDRQVLPMYELTCEFATLEPPPPELQQLFWPCTATRRSWTPSPGSWPG
jgi:2-polyprenyl-6-methoxyphenol hydroxylase-like FAD-dependent oxidoreductase